MLGGDVFRRHLYLILNDPTLIQMQFNIPQPEMLKITMV